MLTAMYFIVSKYLKKLSSSFYSLNLSFMLMHCLSTLAYTPLRGIDKHGTYAYHRCFCPTLKEKNFLFSKECVYMKGDRKSEMLHPL